jgi:hypothetical protein
MLCLLTAALAPAWAQSPPVAPKTPPSVQEQAHRADDIARHRQMARAHEEAARCLEVGLPERQCQERLRAACKGIAVGQYCGMRHAD